MEFQINCNKPKLRGVGAAFLQSNDAKNFQQMQNSQA